MKAARLLTIIVILLLVINSILLWLTWTQESRGLHNDRHVQASDFLIRELSLTDVQKKQFEDLRNQHRHAVDSLNNKIRDLKDSLFIYVSEADKDTSLANALIAKIGKGSSLIDRATFYHFKQLRRILNSGQQEKFDGLIQQVIKMMGQPQPPQGGPRPGGSGPEGPAPDGRQPGPPPGGAPPF